MDKTSFTETENRTHKNAPPSRDAVGAALAQIGKIKSAGANMRDEIEAYAARQPLAALGIAAGAGFVLGSVFGSRLGRLALLAAVGYAAQEVVDAALGEGGVRKLLVEEASQRMRGAKSTPSLSQTS
jgi:hypothetical protein